MVNARRILTVLFALCLTLLLTPLSPAAAAVTLGKRCEGSTVVRCAWVVHDPTTDRVRGYGSVQDKTSGTDAVRVSVTLARWNPSYERYETVGSSPQASGYEQAQAATGLVRCGDGEMFRAEAVWEWNGTDAGRIQSGGAVIHYC